MSPQERVEGGGLLYHRPARSRRRADAAWEFDRSGRAASIRARCRAACIRSWAPGHRKCKSTGDAWLSEAARRRPAGGIRTLRVRDGEVSYDLGVTPAENGATDMIFIDGEMWRVPPADYALLELEGLA